MRAENLFNFETAGSPPSAVRYIPPDRSVWTGRVDAEPDGGDLRYHQVVKTLDLRAPDADSVPAAPFHSLLGFECDLGVRRNQGRPGAAEGPLEIRRRLANLTLPQGSSSALYDTGSVQVVGEPTPENLQKAQEALEACVRRLHAMGSIPILLGGGHEMAKGHALGTFKAFPDARIGILNVDAHFDLRDDAGGPSSGTPFTEIHAYQAARNRPFDYVVLGIQPASTTQALFRKALRLGCRHMTASEIQQEGSFPRLSHLVHGFAAPLDGVILSVCMDAFDSAYAPGVSAPASGGLSPGQVFGIVRTACDTQKVIGFEIAETSPRLEIGRRTSRLAAALVDVFLRSR